MFVPFFIYPHEKKFVQFKVVEYQQELIHLRKLKQKKREKEINYMICCPNDKTSQVIRCICSINIHSFRNIC